MPKVERNIRISNIQKEIDRATFLRENYLKQGNKADADRQQKYIDRANSKLLAEIAKGI